MVLALVGDVLANVMTMFHTSEYNKRREQLT